MNHRFLNNIAPVYAQFVFVLSLCVFLGSVNLAGAAVAEPIGQALAYPAPQQHNFHFNRLESTDLDSISEIFSIVQDKRGFMWFGGEKGLARYDGHNFNLYRHDDNDKTSLSSSSRISNLVVDNEGHVWLATDRGINRYNSDTNDFTHFENEADSGGSHIISLMLDRKGDLWIASDKGLSQWISALGKFSAVELFADKKKINIKTVGALLQDSQGIIWCAVAGGLGRIDPNTLQYQFYPRAESVKNPTNDVVMRLYEDRQERLWLGTLSNGLSRFDRTTKTFTQYKHDPSDATSLGSDEVRGIYEDQHNNLWVATYGGGLNRLNEDNTASVVGGRVQFDHYVAHLGEVGSIATDKVGAIFEDHSGGLWFGHFPSGVSTLNKYATTFHNFKHELGNVNSLSNDSILSVVEAEAGNLWVGTEKGLNHIDRHSGEIKRYPTNPLTDRYSALGLPVDPVLALLVDSTGDLWVGTWLGGLSRFNSKTKQFTHYPAVPGDQNGNAVWSLVEDSRGSIWVGTSSVLCRYVREQDTFVRYEHAQNDPNSILQGNIYSLKEDRRGNLWVGSTSGLDVLIRESGTFRHFVHSNTDSQSIGAGDVFSIAEDSDGFLWFGLLGGGISKLEDSEPASTAGRFKNFHAKDGLPDEFVTGILTDKQGMLWLSTGYGLSKFNPKTLSFHNYNTDYGLPGNVYNRAAHVKMQQGELVFGSTTGLTIFDPADLFVNAVVPPIVFTDFKLFNKSAVVGAVGSPLAHAFTETKSVTLSHEQSVFSFEFSALNFIFPAANRYAYRLEGFDKGWTYSGAEHAATYTNLDAGSYIFHVKGANNEGVWNERGAVVNLIVLPPLWKTWWAYGLYVLVFFVFIVRIFYSQYSKRQNAERQSRLLELKVRERTAEIHEKNNDIKIMLSSMRQGILTILPGGAIHQEFSSILESIFEVSVIAGDNALTLLFGKANISGDTLSATEAAINAIIGETEMHFDLNSHLLIGEFEVLINEQVKFLTIDWSPVVLDCFVVKLMVSVRDVTLLKKMEIDALIKKRELDIIAQLLNIQPEKFQLFLASIKRYIAESRVQIENNAQRSSEVIALLFRNMHTIKGGCRTYSLDYLSSTAHEVESAYASLMAVPELPWDSDRLLNDLMRVDTLLQEYETVFYSVLGRRKHWQEAGTDSSFLRDNRIMQTIQQCVVAAHANYPALFASQELLPIQAILQHAIFDLLSDVLADVVSALPSIASQLNKAAPNVYIEDNGLRIQPAAAELLMHVFSHIFHNSLDHGIETAEERLQCGKLAAGNIGVFAIVHNNRLFIHVKDDGQGLNIMRLFQRGLDVGVWQSDDQPSFQEIANLIFVSGVSTKESVTRVSGRGVGMDAVKTFLLEQGADISINLLNCPADASHSGLDVMVSFELILDLPEDMFVSLPAMDLCA